MLLNLLLKRLDTICSEMVKIREITTGQDKAIVELQTRCAFHCDIPLKNPLMAHQ